jgi:pimeloyl-ACP methyl ester carboxylesterase
VDLRRFCRSDYPHGIRLPVTWSEDKDFIRYFGPVTKRLQGPVDPWTPERVYCRYDRALRFSSSYPGLLTRDLPDISFYGVSRRFYPATVRNDLFHADLQIAGRGRHFLPRGPGERFRRYTPVRLNVSSAVDLILSMPTTVRSRTGVATSAEFGRVGTPIAQSFEAATTIGDLHGDVVAGKPAVAIELDSEDKATAKWSGSWKVDDLELSATTVMFHHDTIPVFVIARPSRLDHYRARTLRAHLLRLHAEREYLRRMARLLSNDGFIDSVGPRQLESIQEALNSNLAVLTRARSFGHLTQDIASAFMADRTLSGAELETLVDRIQPFRPVIRRRLDRLIEQEYMAEKGWREFIARDPEGRNQNQALGPGTGTAPFRQPVGHEGRSVTKPSPSPGITRSQEERLAHQGHKVPETIMMGVTLVTIHGFWSSPATWERLSEVWRADEELRGLRIHSYGYLSPKQPRLPFSVTRVPEYDDIAQTLATEYATALANESDIAMVTHSQGGLILQRFLAWMINEGRARELSRIRSVVMLACPNGGSEYLESLRRGLGYGRHPQAGNLRVLNRQVADTQRTVLQRVINATALGDHQCHIPFHVYAGASDNIVKAASAQAAFPGASTIAGNHFTILDPASLGNRTAETVKRHLLADITASSARHRI